MGRSPSRSGPIWLRKTGATLTILLLAWAAPASGAPGDPEEPAKILHDVASDSLPAWTVADSMAFQLLRQIAREDTLPIDYVFGDWVDTEEHRPTLAEILGWCIEHEKDRFASVHDITYRERSRTLLLFDPQDPQARRIGIESVEQVYAEQPDRRARVSLGTRTWDSEEDEPEVEVEVEVTETQRSMSDLPFFFENLSDYRFEILDRTILADRILYRIGFEPRSEFATAPTGQFLVDTGNYQILRAELSLKKNVPYPLIFKGVDYLILERKQHGEVWLIDNLKAQLSMRKLPGVSMPRLIQVEMQVEEVRFDEGVPDSVWTQ